MVKFLVTVLLIAGCTTVHTTPCEDLINQRREIMMQYWADVDIEQQRELLKSTDSLILIICDTIN